MYKHGTQNFKIELLENYNCNSRRELNTKEGEYIRSFNPFLNSVIAGRTPRRYYADNVEHIKQYRDGNKNTIRERDKKYYQNNKEHRQEYSKQFYQNNKDMCKARSKQHYEQKKQEKTNTL